MAALNDALQNVGSRHQIQVYRSKYLNNIVEQDHRGPKRRTRPTMGFKSFNSAAATLDGIETAHMIRKGQLGTGCPFTIYASLAAYSPSRLLYQRENVNFATEPFMKVHVAEMYHQLSHDGQREMVRNGRAYAYENGCDDPESAAHFVTLMWKIGANFFLQPDFFEIAKRRNIVGAQKINLFYEVDADLATHAIMNPDERYWFPELLEPEVEE